MMIKRIKGYILPVFIFSAAIALTWHFLESTPAGFYNKIFSVGSSLCHQIPSHSFIADGTQFPICARCTGLYLGSLIGLAYAFGTGREAGIPKAPYLILLAVLFILWAGDGLNSFISDYLNRPFLHETTNITRLATGFGMGLLMATALTTLFNLTIWKDSNKTPVLRHPAQIAGYALLCLAASLLIFTLNAFIFKLTAYLVIFSAFGIITLLYTVFWVITFHKENHFTKCRELVYFLAAGFSTALLQIILLNTIRSTILF